MTRTRAIAHFLDTTDASLGERRSPRQERAERVAAARPLAIGGTEASRPKRG